MASLNGQLISGTYPALIKFSDNNALSATLRPLSDGVGSELPVEVSTSTFSVTGTLNVTTGQVTGLNVADLADANTLATIASVTIITNDLQAQITSNDTDITNLQNADVTLQGNIDNEESARITADANLQTQIDNLAAGSGSVISIDGVEGVVDLVEGNSIDITPNTVTGQITIAVETALSNQVSTNASNIATNTSAITDLENGVGNVTAFNTLTGDVSISAGTNITFNTVGNDIQINASGTGGSAVDDVNGLTGAIDIVSTDLDLLTVAVDAVNNEIELTPILPRTMLEDVKNVSGGALTKGMALHVTGSTGNEAEVIKADASLGLAAHLILNEDLPNNLDTGKAVAVGFINNVSVPDTTNFQAGTEVYLGNGGGFTHLKPTGTSIVQYLGMVLNASTTSGAGTVSGIIQNLGVENQLPNLAQNFVWVGDANGVPQEVAVSSLGGITINNNTDGYLLTATGATDTIDGEPKLRWNTSTQTLTLESSNSTNGLTFDGGTFGAANPKISTTGFTGINVDTNLILENQTKIAFDTDAVNTYIAADLTTPENLTINADGYVDVYIADGFRVWENNAAPAPMFRVDKSGDFPRVGIGANVTTTNSELYVNGKVQANEFIFDFAAGPTLTYQGETVTLGSTATTAGQLYAWNGTSWVLADADVESAARSLLAIAVANTSGKGMLVNGWYKTATTYASGQLYMSPTAGGITSTPPSTTGQFVRVIGHGINNTTIRFNPSNDYFTVE